MQDAAPGCNWNNQATIHTVVIHYYQYINNSNGIEHKSLIVIFDCMSHDTVAFFLYLHTINDVVRNICSRRPTKVSYILSGAPHQYENFKNFVNIYNHENDFGIPAEWHFFATVHGKDPYDGLGGTLKRLAARASLQHPSQDQITTAHYLAGGQLIVGPSHQLSLDMPTATPTTRRNIFLLRDSNQLEQ